MVESGNLEYSFDENSACNEEIPNKRVCHRSIVEHDVTIKMRFEKLENGIINVSHNDIVVDGIVFGLIQKGFALDGTNTFS